MAEERDTEQLRQTERTTVKRAPERARFDRALVNEVLDEALICHVATNGEDGTPRMIPTIHARHENVLYLHGSRASRTARAIQAGTPLCLAATIIDGLVLARSAFHHSMNYRSVVLYGTAEEVTDPDELLLAAQVLTDHVVRGRSADVRMPNESEYKQTTILRFPIEEGSAKIRTGGPNDDPEDYDLPMWAGVLPLRLDTEEPITDSDSTNATAPPNNVTSYER